MTFFRILLAVLGITVLIYTVIAASNDGINLFATTIPAVGDFGWQGQFHLDFATYLILSGLWVAWRHGFSPTGVVFGVLAANLGMIFLSLYLLIASYRARGDMRAILMGDRVPRKSL